MKNGTSGIWLLVALAVAAVVVMFVVFSVEGSKPRAQEDEFPEPEPPPST